MDNFRSFKLISLVLILIALSLSAQAKDHVFFLIHGLLGDHTTFCDTTMFLEAKSTKDNRIFAPLLQYDTKNPNLDAIEFVPTIAQQISNFYRDKKLPLDTEFSLIGHSQGGIVSIKFIDKCLVRNNCESLGLNLPKNLVNFISMGTPFWGSSKAAKLVYSLLEKYVPAQQLEALATGSLSLTNMRKSIVRHIDPKTGKWNKSFPYPELNIINITGEISESKILRKLVGLESDFVVDNTAANLDAYYHIESEGETKIDVKTFKSSLVSGYFPTTFAHVPIRNIPGVACIRSVDQYRNPSARILSQIVDKLFYGIELDPIKPVNALEFAESLQNFSTDLKLYLPIGYQRSLNIKKKNIRIQAETPELFEAVTLPNSLVSKYSGFNDEAKGEKNKRFLSYFHSGRFKKQYGYSPFEGIVQESQVTYEIHGVDGWKPKRVSLKIAPTLNSYAELQLQPSLPFPALRSKEGFERLTENKRFFLAGIKAIPHTSEVELFYFDLEQSPEKMLTSVWSKDSILPSGFTNQNIKYYAGRCFAGRTGQIIGIHQNQIFNRINGEEIGTFPPDQEVRVLGRYQLGRPLHSLLAMTEIDRYLIALPLTGELGWMNVVDLDVEPCL